MTEGKCKFPSTKKNQTHAYTICVNDEEVMRTRHCDRQQRFLFGISCRRSFVTAYCWLEALFFFLVLIYCLARSSEPQKYFIYLSHWNQALAALYYFLKAVYQTREKRVSEFIVWLRNSNASCSGFVMIMYWLIVYPSLSRRKNGEEIMSRLAPHGLIFAYAMIETAIILNERRWRFREAYHPLIFGSCWVAFSLAHYNLDGRNFKIHGNKPYVYEFVDWRVPARTILCTLVSGICLVITHFFFAGIDKLKNKVLNTKTAKSRRIFRPPTNPGL